MRNNSFPSPTAPPRELPSSTPAACPTDFCRAKNEGHKLSMITCYDYTFARLLSKTAIDGILVGDSAGMVMHGHDSTLSMTIDLMRLHTEAVVRGAPGKFVVADMPFLSYRKGLAAALDSAQILMSAGAHAVKLEGVDGHEDVVQTMAQSGIPVMGHLGLQPQSVRAYGGFKIQGRNGDAAQVIARQASLLENLGAFAVVLECIPAALARDISKSLRIPTIGIGAGVGCDGQILVLQDLLGMNLDFRPKFARPFSDGARNVLDAVKQFDEAVKAGTFPTLEESYQ
jgi:3-methyl-2-oxobutanoate hydroxymethyltransferase